MHKFARAVGVGDSDDGDANVSGCDSYTSVISVKLYLRDERTNGRTDKETRFFIRCVCQGRPSYGGWGGNEPRCSIET